MIRSILITGLAVLLASRPLQAQIMPQPSAENPRIQSIAWQQGQEAILTTLPMTGLTVMLEPGEQVQRVSLEDQAKLDVRVSSERDGILIIPKVAIPDSGMLVQTDRRDYRFSVRSNDGLMAAYLVKFEFGIPQQTQTASLPPPEPTGKVWHYRLRGDREVRPAAIHDDGQRTSITFGPDQALPAVFAIGPTGKEEVVNGYMRGDVFVIDRVHQQLVFRIDKEKATARRRERPESDNG